MEGIKLSKYYQIGILVKNINQAAKFYSALMNFTGKINIVKQTNTVLYKGKEATFKMKKIMQYFGGIQFEIIELLESNGEHLYSEFLKEGKLGIHHLGIYTKRADELIEYFKNKFDIDVIQTGKYGKVKFDYLNTTESLGFYLELISF